MLHSRALTQRKKCASESLTIAMGILPSGRYCSRDCCPIQVCHALKKKKIKGRKDLSEYMGVLRECIWMITEGWREKKHVPEKEKHN